MARCISQLPRTFAWVALGGSLDDLGSPEARIAIALLVAMAVIGAVRLWDEECLVELDGIAVVD